MAAMASSSQRSRYGTPKQKNGCFNKHQQKSISNVFDIIKIPKNSKNNPIPSPRSQFLTVLSFGSYAAQLSLVTGVYEPVHIAFREARLLQQKVAGSLAKPKPSRSW